MIERGGAEERVLRIVSLLFGIGAVIFGLLSLGAILTQLGSAPPWWTAVALLLVLGTSIALGAAAPVAPVAVLRGLAAAVSVGYLAVAVSMPFVFEPVATSGAAPWPLGLTALATTAAAVAFPAAVAWGAAVLLGVLVAVDRVTTASIDLLGIALQDAAYATFFAAVYVALTLGARAAARHVDLAASAADDAAIGAVLDRVRQDERSRVDALVHDRLLATLLLAGRGVPGSEADVRSQSTAALAGLRGLADGSAAARDLEVGELVDRLRNQVTIAAPWAEVEARLEADAPPVPAAVAEAMLGAAGEALRNAVQHAGAGATIALRVEASRDSIAITLIDDGAGFEPRAVPAGRLGISSSIVGRMRSIGGSGEVRTRAGRGTAVQLTWRRP